MGALSAPRRLGARVHAIPPDEFHHGRTRNVGARSPRRNLVFTSQDAYAASHEWLSFLTAPLEGGGSPARTVVSSPTRTRARRSATSWISSTEPSREYKRLASANGLTFESTLFSNVELGDPSAHLG